MKKFVRRCCIIAIVAASVALLVNVENICNAAEIVYLSSLVGYLTGCAALFRIWWVMGGNEQF